MKDAIDHQKPDRALDPGSHAGHSSPFSEVFEGISWHFELQSAENTQPGVSALISCGVPPENGTEKQYY